eukprot:11162088-Lingulodinium_polyedra.AAC.1
MALVPVREKILASPQHKAMFSNLLGVLACALLNRVDFAVCMRSCIAAGCPGPAQPTCQEVQRGNALGAETHRVSRMARSSNQ